MNFLSKYADKFVNQKDQEHIESQRKGRFFVISLFTFLVICTFASASYIVLVPGDFVYHIENFSLILVIFLFLLIYKKYGRRLWMINIIAIFTFLPTIQVYQKLGGIYASDMVMYIILPSWIFLVANKKTGYVWFGIGMAIITTFFFLDLAGIKNFRTDIMAVAPSYFLMNYVMATIFLMIFMSVHENIKEKYLKEVITAKTMVEAKSIELENKNKELESKNRDITDSIQYAKKIQFAVLPHEEMIYRSIPLSFILYKPRDIVSGDFFWLNEIDRDHYILACADCTGHGVPGALMAVIGNSLLNQIVVENKIFNPSDILLELDKRINTTLKQEKERMLTVQDGMDISLLKVDKEKKEFIFSSAKRYAVFIRDHQLQEFKGSNSSLGGMKIEQKKFDDIKINFKEDDMIYLFTDGFADQFGGEKRKKFSNKQLKEILFSIHELPMKEQRQKLENDFDTWKGNLEQIDDVLMMGVRF